MNTYLEQIGRQEFVRQYFEQISRVYPMTSTVRAPGNSILSDHTIKAHPLGSKSRLALPWFNRSAVKPQS